MDWQIEGGLILRDDSLSEGVLTFAGGQIAAQQDAHAQRQDARGCLVLPGIVDVHGDAFERVLEPRPGVRFPLDLVFQEADRQLIGNGVTTAFHGLALTWETGLRSLEQARGVVAALRTVRENRTLGCDARINFRWEVFAFDAVRDLKIWLTETPGAIVSINDHTSANVGLPSTHRKLRRMAERMEMEPDDTLRLINKIWARRDEVPAAIVDVCALAQEHGGILFAHDELSPDDRQANRAKGIRVSEFPMTKETARNARDSHEHVVLGAPNVLRGGSQNNAIGAADAVHADLCSVLASDYFYPSQFQAAFRLADEGVPLPRAWNLVSSGPAAASGLHDRGRLEPGMRADVLVVDAQTRRLRSVFVEGRRVYHSE